MNAFHWNLFSMYFLFVSALNTPYIFRNMLFSMTDFSLLSIWIDGITTYFDLLALGDYSLNWFDFFFFYIQFQMNSWNRYLLWIFSGGNIELSIFLYLIECYFNGSYGWRGWVKINVHHLRLIRVNRVKWCLWFIALISFHLNWLLDHSSIWLNDTLNWNQKSKWNYIKLISTKWNYDWWILSIYL